MDHNKNGKDIGVVHNFLMHVTGYSTDVLSEIQQMVTLYLEDLFEMKGAFVITRDLSDTEIYSKSFSDFSKIKEIADLIATFNQKKFLKSISGPGYKKIDSMRYENYHIYLARVTEKHTIFILFADSRDTFDDLVDTIRNDIQNKMKLLSGKTSLIPNPKLSPKTGSIVSEKEEVDNTSIEKKDIKKFNIPAPL